MSAKSLTPNQMQNFAHRHTQSWIVGNGVLTEFALPQSVLRVDDMLVFVGGALKRPYQTGTAHDYKVRGLSDPVNYPGDSNRVKFAAAPGNGVDVCFSVAGG